MVFLYVIQFLALYDDNIYQILNLEPNQVSMFQLKRKCAGSNLLRLEEYSDFNKICSALDNSELESVYKHLGQAGIFGCGNLSRLPYPL